MINITILLLFFTIQQTASAKDIEGYKDLKFGMSETEVGAILDKKCRSKTKTNKVTIDPFSASVFNGYNLPGTTGIYKIKGRKCYKLLGKPIPEIEVRLNSDKVADLIIITLSDISGLFNAISKLNTNSLLDGFSTKNDAESLLNALKKKYKLTNQKTKMTFNKVSGNFDTDYIYSFEDGKIFLIFTVAGAEVLGMNIVFPLELIYQTHDHSDKLLHKYGFKDKEMNMSDI